MMVTSKEESNMNEDNNNNFILVDEDKPKEKKWKKIVKILSFFTFCSGFSSKNVLYSLMFS